MSASTDLPRATEVLCKRLADADEAMAIRVRNAACHAVVFK